jgi:transposase
MVEHPPQALCGGGVPGGAERKRDLEISCLVLIIRTKPKENQNMPRKEPIKTLEEKLSIILEGLKENVNISDLCRRHGISQASFYKWRDKFLEGGKTALAGNGGTGASEVERARIAELERVIGQQAVQIQVLKKNLKLL